MVDILKMFYLVLAHILWGISEDIRSVSGVTNYFVCEGIHYSRHYIYIHKKYSPTPETESLMPKHF